MIFCAPFKPKNWNSISIFHFFIWMKQQAQEGNEDRVEDFQSIQVKISIVS
jgi:hypothetical protein